MIRFLILALALLQVSDPVADAIGDGTLVPPTAPVYATTANFDLQEVVLTDDPTLTLRITMGALDNPGSLPLGFSNAVIEVYLDTAPGGAEALLPGSGMRMPSGSGWEYALRLTGDEAYLVVAQEEGTPADWAVTALDVATDGTTLVVRSSLPRPRQADLYALTGVYDAFGQQPWRAVASAPSPWAFSSPTQTSPVIDLLAARQVDQARALQTGTLPRTTKPSYGVGWLLLMLAGIVAATVGLYFRRKAGMRQARPETVAAPARTLEPIPNVPVAGSAGSAGSARPASMWGEGTALPLPRVPRHVTATDGAAGNGSSGAAAGEGRDRGAAGQAEATHEDKGSAGAPAAEPAGPWQDVLVPTYSVRPALQSDGSRPGGSGDGPPDDADTQPDERHGVAVGPDSHAEVVADAGGADVAGDADGGEAGDADGGADERVEAVAIADVDLEPRGDDEPDDDPETSGSSKPFVPIVPLPAGPPARRPHKAAPVAPTNDAAQHPASNARAFGDEADTVDGWKPVLVDPHDTFLDASHDPDEAELWPAVRAVRARPERAPASQRGSREDPDQEPHAQDHADQEHTADQNTAQDHTEQDHTAEQRPEQDHTLHQPTAREAAEQEGAEEGRPEHEHPERTREDLEAREHGAPGSEDQGHGDPEDPRSQRKDSNHEGLKHEVSKYQVSKNESARNEPSDHGAPDPEQPSAPKADGDDPPGS